MSKIKVSEIFYSVQGEGLWTGVPSVFLRTFGCNFSCRGFGLPHGQLSEEPERIAKDVDKYKNYDDLPLALTGCDSYAAWHPSFKHLSPLYTTDAIVERMRMLIPNRTWTQTNGQDVHLVITGGEPLLGWQRSYSALLDEPGMKDLKNLTFETNATQPLQKEFAEYLSKRNIHVTWSCSPKLSVSGEKWDESIRPAVVNSYCNLDIAGGSSLYLKFVVADNNDLVDVCHAVREYEEAGIRCPVYLMPVGGTVESYQFNNQQVAKIAMDHGFRYSPRLQVDLFGNAWGT
jgi:organic radical activating enzyme